MNSERVGYRLQWTQWLAALAASSVMLSIDGLDIVWMSERKEEHAAPLIAIYTILVIFGAIIGAVFADNFGRKNTLLMMTCFVMPRTINLLFDWTGQSWINNFYLHGFLKVGSGITCTLVPLYISEIADTNNRGNLMVMQLSVVQAGILALHTTISLHVYHDYHSKISVLGAALFAVSIFFHVIILGVCPETPQYLNWKKMYRGTAQSLAFFRRINHVKIKDNATKLPANADGKKKAHERKGKISEIFQTENRKKLAIIFSLITIKWASGFRVNEQILIPTIIEYSWPSAIPFPVPAYFTAIFIFSIFIMFTVGVFERRLTLLLVILGSLTTSVIAMILVSDDRVFFVISNTIQHLCHLSFTAATLAYVGKFFPMNIRATAIALTISFEVVCRSIVFYMESLILLNFGTYYDFIFHEFWFIYVVYIAGFILVLILFPKTSKIPNSEIEVEISNGIEYL